VVEFGRTAEALAMARLNAELFPESGNAYDTLGEMLAHAGERDAAIAAYERSLELDPDNDNARERLRALRDGAPPR
jgi:predicted TPR repeat methyltransferase